MRIKIPNKMHHTIIPGILEKDWESIEKKIETAKLFADTIHIDLIDGVFAPNKTWMDPKPFEKYKNKVKFELHMMVNDPLSFLNPFAEVGFDRFIGHIERMKDLPKFIARGQLLGEVGIGIDSTTSIDALKISLEDLDFICVMTVKAGFSNQSFMPEMLGKVKQIKAKDQFIPIEIDGGVSDANIIKAKELGVNRFVSTGFLFGKGNPQENYNTLCGLIK